MKCQKQSSECSVKDILKIFAKFTRKHLCWSLLIRDYRDSCTGVSCEFCKNLTLQNISEVLLLKRYMISLLKIILSNLRVNSSISHSHKS